MVCAPGDTPQKKINTKNKHYTVLAPTDLNGEAVMCCVIFSGKKPNAMCETGLDLSAETIGDISDPDFLNRTVGRENDFLEDPLV